MSLKKAEDKTKFCVQAAFRLIDECILRYGSFFGSRNLSWVCVLVSRRIFGDSSFDDRTYQQAKLMASDGAATDLFGRSVAIVGDTVRREVTKIKPFKGRQGRPGGRFARVG